jgi:hypothetical protein
MFLEEKSEHLRLRACRLEVRGGWGCIANRSLVGIDFVTGLQ